MANDKIVVDLVVDNKQANKQIDETKDKTVNLSKSFNSLKLAGVAALAGIGVGFAGVIKQAAKFETINTKFEVLTGSVGEASKALKQLQAFSAKTPFQFEDVAKAGQTLLAFGFSTDELTARLQQLGDVSAATGKPIGEIAVIFGQVSAAGKLTGERFLQLVEAGVNVGPAIAKTMGVAESGVRDLISAGKVTFEVFDKAFKSLSGEGGIAFGAIEKQSRTFSGAISTLKDNFTLLQVSLGQRLLPVLRAIAIGMTTFIADLNSGTSIVDGFVIGIRGLISVALALKTAFEIVGDAIGATLGTAFGAIVQALSGNFEAAKKTIEDGFAGGLQGAKDKILEFNDDMEKLGTLFEEQRAANDEKKIAKAKDTEEAITGITKKELEARRATTQSSLSQIATLQNKNNKVLVIAGKAAALANIAISTQVGYMKAIEQLGPILGPVLGTGVLVAGAASAAEVVGVKLARGGFAEMQGGGSVSSGLASVDSVPAVLERGEFVAPNRGTNSADAVINARARELAGEEAGGQTLDVNIIINDSLFGDAIEATVTQRRALGTSAI